jgi:choline dehydrogenase-like flavoprotein
VRTIDANTKQRRSFQARVVFVCASTVATTQILLASQSDYFPRGLGNRSDALGRHLMDHVVGIGASGTHPGFLDRYYYGRRPTGFYVPRYINITENAGVDFVRGFGFQGYSGRSSWQRGEHEVGVGAELKQRMREPGRWEMSLIGFGEMLPRPDNRVTLDKRLDSWGIPLVHIDCTHGENERRLAERANQDAVRMLIAAGFENVTPFGTISTPGTCVHEMGTARMGRDPANSVLNGHNQAHDIPNLFITDGSCMTSTGTVNPSLTYMALSARAANYAADLLSSGEI